MRVFDRVSVHCMSDSFPGSAPSDFRAPGSFLREHPVCFESHWPLKTTSQNDTGFWSPRAAGTFYRHYPPHPSRHRVSL